MYIYIYIDEIRRENISYSNYAHDRYILASLLENAHRSMHQMFKPKPYLFAIQNNRYNSEHNNWLLIKLVLCILSD